MTMRESGFDRAVAALDDRDVGYPWGVRILDEMMGGVRKGRLHVVGARPQNGKTCVLLNWLNTVYDWSQKQPHRPGIVAFFTERDPSVVYRSWAALRCGLVERHVLANDWDTLSRTDHGASPAAIEARVRKMLGRLGETQDEVYFPTTNMPTVEGVVAEIAKANDRFGRVGVVIYDHVQKVTPARGQDRFSAVAALANQLQLLAVEEGMAVMAGSQLKREEQKVFDKFRPPSMDAFKSAGEIEENADVAIGLFRPLKRMTRQEEQLVRDGQQDLEAYKVTGQMAVKVLKHRYNSEVADRIVRVGVAAGRISDLPGRPPYEHPATRGDAYED